MYDVQAELFPGALYTVGHVSSSAQHKIRLCGSSGIEKAKEKPSPSARQEERMALASTTEEAKSPDPGFELSKSEVRASQLLFGAVVQVWA